MFIDGKFVESQTNEWIDLHNPATNEVISRVPKCTQAEMQAALESNKKAFKSWSQQSVLSRQQVMFKLQTLVKSNMGELAKNITKEQGKTLADAEGDVLRGLRKSSFFVFTIFSLTLLLFFELKQRWLSILVAFPHLPWARL